jgi:hypothetical protein
MAPELAAAPAAARWWSRERSVAGAPGWSQPSSAGGQVEGGAVPRRSTGLRREAGSGTVILALLRRALTGVVAREEAVPAPHLPDAVAHGMPRLQAAEAEASLRLRSGAAAALLWLLPVVGAARATALVVAAPGLLPAIGVSSAGCNNDRAMDLRTGADAGSSRRAAGWSRGRHGRSLPWRRGRLRGAGRRWRRGRPSDIAVAARAAAGAVVGGETAVDAKVLVGRHGAQEGPAREEAGQRGGGGEATGGEDRGGG